MIIEKSLIMSFATWGINILFWVGYIPQIRLNFRLKSARGLSDLTLLGHFYGYITYTFYTLCLSLPLAFKVMAPLSLLLVFVLIFQRFFYEEGYKKDKKLLAFYGGNIMLALFVVPFALTDTVVVGNITGWIATALWCVVSLPQIVKVASEKS